MTDTECDKIQIDGHQIALTEDRSVWAGKADDGSWYLQFRNGDMVTKLRLSQEALDALRSLTRVLTGDDWEEIKVLRFVYKMHEMEWSQHSGEAASEIER